MASRATRQAARRSREQPRLALAIALRPVALVVVEGALAHMKDILAGAISSIPSCPGEAMLANLVTAYARKMTVLPEAAAR